MHILSLSVFVPELLTLNSSERLIPLLYSSSITIFDNEKLKKGENGVIGTDCKEVIDFLINQGEHAWQLGTVNTHDNMDTPQVIFS